MTDIAVSKNHKAGEWKEPDAAAVELYRKYRPRKFKDVLGQDAAVRVLEEFVKRKEVPHALLFTGPSGCGKTTLARILARVIGVGKQDLAKVNCANCGPPLDTVRGIKQAMSLHPMSGPCRVWILDEVQALSRANFAQQALLDVLEEMPSHAYFFLCTTDPDKLLKAVRGRCTPVALRRVADDVLRQLCRQTLLAEKTDPACVADETLDKLIDHADGSAREALVLLGKVYRLPGQDEQTAALERASPKKFAYDLCKLMMNPRVRWPEVAAVLRDLEEDPENVRRAILGYLMGVLLGNPEQKREPADGKRAGLAAAGVSFMRDHLYDAGKPGLVANCYEFFVKGREGGR